MLDPKHVLVRVLTPDSQVAEHDPNVDHGPHPKRVSIKYRHTVLLVCSGVQCNTYLSDHFIVSIADLRHFGCLHLNPGN